MTVSGKELSYLRRDMRYTENFKKDMVRLLIAKGIIYKKLSDLTEISQITLSKWDNEYRQAVIDEKQQEERRLREQQEEDKHRLEWHRYSSGAGYYE